MAYSFYLGSSGSEKTERAFLDMIEASLEAPEERFFVLVPEQYSMLVQKKLLALHPRHLCVRLRRGRIDHMKDQIRIARLLKRRVKGLNQLVRQLPDKAVRIRDENFFAARQRKFSGGRIQGRKEFIFRENAGVGEPV